MDGKKILEHLKDTKAKVTVFTINGFQVKGVIKGFDEKCVLVVGDKEQRMVYFKAISTIAPETLIAEDQLSALLS